MAQSRKKYALSALILGFLATFSFAQTGTFIQTIQNGKEILEILPNKTFDYHYQTAWAKSHTHGYWKQDGDKLILHSEKQLKYTVSSSPAAGKEDLLVILTSSSNKKGAQKIEKVFFNKDSPCFKNNDKALEMLEQYNRIMNSGSHAQRDSLKNAYVPQYYTCPDFNQKLDKLVILFDKKILTVKPEDPSHNQVQVAIEADENPVTRYFNQEEWAWDKKQLVSPRQEVFKKGKK
jgi:hypothetical protein